MSKGWKIGLTIAASVMLLLMLGAGACVYYFSQLGKDIQQDLKAGERFGETADEDACLKEAFTRSKGKNAISGTASATVFLVTCLEKSKPTPGFCNDVPSRQDKEAAKIWAGTKCQELGQNDMTCGAILGAVVGHCQSRERDAEPEPTNEEKKK